MNVFFEGPNCSGKSTIADLVKNALRWDQLNLHHRKGDQFTRYLSEYSRTDTVLYERTGASSCTRISLVVRTHSALRRWPV